MTLSLLKLLGRVGWSHGEKEIVESQDAVQWIARKPKRRTRSKSKREEENWRKLISMRYWDEFSHFLGSSLG